MSALGQMTTEKLSMAHVDALSKALLPFAKRMLERRWEFCPFSATMTSDGKIVNHGADAGKERPMSQGLIEILTQAFRQQACSVPNCFVEAGS